MSNSAPEEFVQTHDPQTLLRCSNWCHAAPNATSSVGEHILRLELLDRCTTCGSGHCRIAKAPRGPPRMFCCNCHRPLERAHPRAIELEPTARPLWDKVIAFEAELRAAMHVKVPDQFRFNNTSARQLLEETSHICLLLARCHARPAMRWLMFDRFTILALALEQYCVGLLPYELLLALADLPLRRCLQAICAAILNKNFDTGESLAVNSPAPPIDRSRGWLEALHSITLLKAGSIPRDPPDLTAKRGSGNARKIPQDHKARRRLKVRAHEH